MKKIVIIYMFLISLLSSAHEYNIGVEELKSRTIADSVLMCFDSIAGPRMLYSINDEDFYIVVKTENDVLKEYYVNKNNSVKDLFLKEISNDFSTEKRKFRRYYKSIKEKLLDLFIFEDVVAYHTLAIDESKFFFCKRNDVYYVIKDENGVRYDEFRLSLEGTINFFNHKLHGYIITQIFTYKQYV